MALTRKKADQYKLVAESAEWAADEVKRALRNHAHVVEELKWAARDLQRLENARDSLLVELEEMINWWESDHHELAAEFKLDTGLEPPSKESFEGSRKTGNQGFDEWLRTVKSDLIAHARKTMARAVGEE